MPPLRVQGGGLRAFAGSGSREISLKDGSIRDLTCALIISQAPLQISLSNQQTANHDRLPLLTGSCSTTTTNAHIPHYVPRLHSHWSKTPFLITAAAICLATIEKTGREKLTVRLKGSISGHKYEYRVMFFFLFFLFLWHILPFAFTVSELLHNNLNQLLLLIVKHDWLWTYIPYTLL